MTEIERIEEDLVWLQLMLEFTEKTLQIKEEMNALNRSNISQLLYLTLQDGLASNLAHVGEQLDTINCLKKLSENSITYLGLTSKSSEISTITGIKIFLTTSLIR